ncbi:hypothetical protein TKK_0016798 [Trichogramma kaykai]|uniref:Uncharacterized protein n=1 Tax=Trichogramma kaykai TaxID=54128 RepID=A0ABD2W3G4_9HYME
MEAEKSTGIEFAIGGLAGICTGILTNPADVLKTRLQLQGELAAPSSYVPKYRGAFHAALLIARHEGLAALQAGLVPVLGLQVILNGARLGSYHFGKGTGWSLDEQGRTDVLRTALLAGFSASAAVSVASPLYLAKVKLQAHSFAEKDNKCRLNTYSIFKSLWRENGFKALYRGWNANIPRLFVGSAVQLTVYGLSTDWLEPIQIMKERPMLLTFVTSVVSGTCMVFTIHPFDVMATRLYNQGSNKLGQGNLYNGMFDALKRIVRTEGFFGLYKGIFPNWLRLAPYVVICQVFYQKLALIYEESRK